MSLCIAVSLQSDYSLAIMPLLDRLSRFAIPFSVIKSFLGQKLYLQGLAVLAGLYYFASRRKVEKVFFPLFIMIGLNFLVAPFYDHLIPTYIRLFQFLAMLGLCHYFWKVFDFKYLPNLLLSWEIISTVFLFIELLLNRPGGTHWLFTSIWRLNLLVGEPNFSSLLLIVVFLIRTERRQYHFSLWNLGLIFMAGSRTAIAVVLVYLILKAFQKLKNTKIWSQAFRISLILLILSPFVMRGMNRFLSDDIKRALIKTTSNRYYIHQIYIDMSIKNPFGVGYFNGYNQYPKHLVRFDNYLKQDLDILSGTQLAEQHNAYIQTLSEFGWPGLILLWFFLVKLYLRIEKNNKRQLPAYLSLLVFINFLNIFNEVAFYLMLAYLLQESEDSSSTAELST
ncbi:MAG: O-antigen ligase family protein [Halobacteriovoraceae bacterium]|nr:O-antigen ligase family protein [Halobacteriovoraceae bacterium]